MKKWFVRIALASLVGMILFVGITFTRRQLAINQIREQVQALSQAAPLSIGETGTPEILPLYEKDAQSHLDSGHCVLYLSRTDSATILFDLGNNLTATSPSPLEKNMTTLCISRDEIDFIFISHRHPDRVGGQNWWTEKTFSLDGLTQPALSQPSYIPEAMTYPGGNLILSATPTRLAEGVATTGLITYAQPFPIWLATPIGDEQALAINVRGKGIVLVTGCGHMGLESLVERAKTVFDAPIIGVVGGLHYGNSSAADLQPEINLVRDLDPQIVALSPHDSEAPTLKAFAQAFPAVY